MAVNELFLKYNLHLLKLAHPEILIVEMIEHFAESTFKNNWLKQNTDMFSDNSDITVICSWPTKIHKNIPQSFLKVDVVSFNLVVC